MRGAWLLVGAVVLAACGGSTKPAVTTVPAKQASVAIATLQPTALATPAQPALLPAGTAAQLGNLKIVFTGATSLPERRNGSSVYTKKPGTDWLELAFTVTNTGQARERTSAISVRIGRIEGSLLTYNNVYHDDELLSFDLYPEVRNHLDGDLAPGETIQGVQVFAVMTADAPFAVRWDTFGHGHADWAVQPQQ